MELSDNIQSYFVFSIITVCYNSENTIERTLISLLNQSFQNFEYIIVDGKSTDRTLDVISKYKSRFLDKLTIISEPDKGIYDAMNKGILMAKGKLIGIVNSDDWLNKNALELVFQSYIANNEQEGIYTGGLRFVYSNGKTQVMMSDYNRFKKMSMKYLMPVRHPATFVSKSVYDKVGLFDISFKVLADKDFIFRSISHHVNFVFIADVLSNMADDGISNSFRGFKKSFIDEISFGQKHQLSSFLFISLLSRFVLVSVVKFLLPSAIYSRFRS